MNKWSQEVFPGFYTKMHLLEGLILVYTVSVPAKAGNLGSGCVFGGGFILRSDYVFG